jgi:hypothetical protein
MNAQTENQFTLSNRNIWIIDDDIPLQAAEFAKDDMLEGSRPIDRGTLLHLLSKVDEWDDPAVMELCNEIVSTADEVKAFLLPPVAIDHLRKGAKAPDVIIFDMKYRSLPDKDTVLESLRTILSECISIIQIYSKEAPEEATVELEPLKAYFASRLQEPLSKKDINANLLADRLSKYLQTSLSTQLATNIRRLSTIAIENVLVRIDNLPLNVAIELLAGENEENFSELELVELLSVKVGDYLRSSDELASAMRVYARQLHVPHEQEKLFIDESVELFSTAVRNRIQTDKWLYEAVQSAKKASDNHVPNEETEKIVQEFFAYRIYDQPKDEIVRTGDIISTSADSLSDKMTDLFMVITPPCDLDKFWIKTRGILTLAKLHPKDIGIHKWIAYANSKPSNISSITSTQNPLVFPSLPISATDRLDYILFLYEIEKYEFDGTNLWKPEENIAKKARFSRPLTYTELRGFHGNMKRICRVSEPFLSGVLAAIKEHLFRAGVPDFPSNEKGRLRKIFNL